MVWCCACLAPAAATARPLEAAACKDLEKEKLTLESAGVPGDMHVKPEEAKMLAADKLQRIQRYVQVSADVLFRCPIGALGASGKPNQSDQVAAAEPDMKPTAGLAKPRGGRHRKSRR